MKRCGQEFYFRGLMAILVDEVYCDASFCIKYDDDNNEVVESAVVLKKIDFVNTY